MDDIANKTFAVVICENDARHVAAQKERRPLGNGVRADVAKGQHVLLGEAAKGDLAHQHVGGGAQAAAQG